MSGHAGTMLADPHAVTTAAVVLEIGGDIGAAVVTAPDELRGHEIEIRRAGTEWDGTHVAFHRRSAAHGSITAAVFPQLCRGEWEVRLRGVPSSPVIPLSIEGGRATRLSYPQMVATPA